MMVRSCLAFVVGCIAAPLGFTAEKLAAKIPDVPTFEAHVRPILKAYCFECHGEEEKPKGGLDLRLRRFIVAGGKSGPAVAVKPQDSPLFVRARDGDMPPTKKKLSADELEVLRRWVATGAKAERPEPEKLAPGLQFTDDERGWWAFQPIKKSQVPSLKTQVTNPIDAFLLAKLEAKGIAFNPPADKATLIRRLSFDLIGLPPTPEEVEAFVKDASPDAYAKRVDRLLASPHYGERWGRHWLDVAGYADSEGATIEDPVRATAWRYRDYVIRSLNADKPFDQFIREQLAGDEMVKRPFANLSADDIDKLTATGFLRMAPDGTGIESSAVAKTKVVADTVRIVSSALLGLTVGCAECHNHRYDPIPQADFYRLRALLEPGYNPAKWVPPASRQVSLYTDADKKTAADLEVKAKRIDAERIVIQNEFIAMTLEKEFLKLSEPIRTKARAAKATPAAKQTAEQKQLLKDHPSLNVDSGSLYLYDSQAAKLLKELADDAAKVRSQKPVEGFVRCLTEEPGVVPPTFLFHRGDPDQPKGQIAPGALNILAESHPLKIDAKGVPTSGRRTAFANWVTDAKNPLTARVLVNRVWLNHFGRGLVGTPGDFGKLGEKPTHPELLDWLASEFTAHGWSLKHLHRVILTSAAYRQSSVRAAATDAADPDNRLLGRFPLRRLDAESVRDGLLAISGKLSSKPFGPPVPVMEDDDGQVVLGRANRDGAGYKLGDENLSAEDYGRRSIYVQMRRSKPLAMLDTFDGAAVEPNCEFRNSSTVTPQSLMLLNNTFVLEQAAALANRLKVDAGSDAKSQAARAWKLAYGVAPTPAELDKAASFLAEQTAYFAAHPAKDAEPTSKAPTKVKTPSPKEAKPSLTPADRALTVFCQVVLMSNRFLYVE